MNICVLEHFTQLANALEKREKVDIAVQTDKGTVRGTFDPLFKTIKFGGFTVPEKELHFWMKAVNGAKIQKIEITKEAPDESRHS